MKKLLEGWRTEIDDMKRRRTIAAFKIRKTYRASQRSRASRSRWPPELMQVAFIMWYRFTMYKACVMAGERPPNFHGREAPGQKSITVVPEWDEWLKTMGPHYNRRRRLVTKEATGFLRFCFVRWKLLLCQERELKIKTTQAQLHYATSLQVSYRCMLRMS